LPRKFFQKGNFWKRSSQLKEFGAFQMKEKFPGTKILHSTGVDFSAENY